MPSSERTRGVRRLGFLAALPLLALGAARVGAGDFDGSRVLICAPVQAFDCAAGEDCGKGLPDEIGAPAFMRIDVPNKAVMGPKRTTSILFVDKSDAQLLLQGTELGYAWSIAVDRETGRMTATLANRENAIVLFGACTVP
jgi:hypothetical protein